ncbi:uncharacterized protein LOC135928486 isoform X1 [Gordionus sp. m RMFG-2023]|uniref:uncharacterized protein LOC135928486 isoform X1 n=1 Tax=Gordionus sp. m RMFG-2023 TaxID=3053472 RepID=UPI0031FD1830
MRFFDDSKYFGFDDGTYRYPMCPMYPDWDKDLETYRHDFSKDTRSEFEKNIDKFIFTNDPTKNAQKIAITVGVIVTFLSVYQGKVHIMKRPPFSGIQTYFLSCGVAALAGWYAPKRYYYNKNKRRMMILWYMRNHRDQWPPERPRKTYGEVITPWFPIRNL